MRTAWLLMLLGGWAWHRIGGGPWQNLVSNTQGGGASQAIVADGHLYHASLHGLRCFAGGQ